MDLFYIEFDFQVFAYCLLSIILFVIDISNDKNGDFETNNLFYLDNNFKTLKINRFFFQKLQNF